MKIILAALALTISASGLAAQDGLNLFYGAIGQPEDGPDTADATPFALGYLRLPAVGGLLLGADIAGEGTMVDSTWGGVTLRQAVSYNAVIGVNVVNADRFRLDAGLLIGLRESVSDCPDSYLGFQCYADQSPDTDYEANFGGIATASFGAATLGLRATGESTQALVGFRF